MSLSLIITIIVLGGWLSSKAFTKIKLPHILGMLIWGLVISALWKDKIPASLNEVTPFFKSLALIVILLRAGLGINRKMLNKIGLPAVLMGFIPCLVEATGLTFAFKFLMDWSYGVSALTAFMLAAVSPAVVVPTMLNLKELGHGAKKEVPTLILAGASLDDVIAFTFFTLSLGFVTTGGSSITKSLLSIPYAIVLGVLGGVILGFLILKIFKHSLMKIQSTERVILLMALSFLFLEFGNWIHIAALLGTMTTGFIIFEYENEIAKELSNKLSKWWLIAEIILFVLIGINVDPKYIVSAGFKGLGIISIGLLCRSIGVLIATAFSDLNKKEKLFCVLAYLPKATVQAALGSVPLAMGVAEGEMILAIAVLAIMVTAPVGLLLIQIFGKRLLAVD